MSQVLAVKTVAFPTDPEGDLNYCNGHPGSAFADWLREKLIPRNFQCDETIQEDYGWGFWVNRDDLTVWVSVGFVPDDANSANSEWIVSATFEVPFVFLKPKLWFKEEKGKALEAEITDALEMAIINDQDMTLLRREKDRH